MWKKRACSVLLALMVAMTAIPFSAVPVYSQEAGTIQDAPDRETAGQEEVLTQQAPQDAAVEMREAFKARRDWVVGALNEIPGLSCRMPGGAFYAFPNIESFGMDSHTFCSRLLHEGGVAAAWGTAFGSFGEGHFRISFANSLENLKIAVDRIAKFTKTL
jgi:aspartate/methionine/tyrosine aminotransferase